MLSPVERSRVPVVLGTGSVAGFVAVAVTVSSSAAGAAAASVVVLALLTVLLVARSAESCRCRGVRGSATVPEEEVAAAWLQRDARCHRDRRLRDRASVAGQDRRAGNEERFDARRADGCCRSVAEAAGARDEEVLVVQVARPKEEEKAADRRRRRRRWHEGLECVAPLLLFPSLSLPREWAHGLGSVASELATSRGAAARAILLACRTGDDRRADRRRGGRLLQGDF